METLQNLMDGIKLYSSEIELVGSRVTCNPPPMDTDQDILVLIKSRRLREAQAYLVEKGFESGPDCSRSNDSEFYSYKNETADINFILTTKREYFDRFMAATTVAKRFNLLNKDDRVALFEAVIRGTRCIDVEFITDAEEPKVEIDFFAINRAVCGG